MLQMTQAFNSRRKDLIPRFAANYHEDSAMADFPLAPEMGRMRPPDRVQHEIDLVEQGWPDGQYEVKEMVAEGDTVILIWEFTGTHKGEFFGRPGTGRPTKATGFEVVQFDRQGQMIRHWDNHEQTTLFGLAQLGYLHEETLKALGFGPLQEL
jgi:hypothetical protein